ncbi:MAG: CmcJ/NvfI family oxidoreductase [Gammaproteobacteria bacterium]|nr:CmcJ/NvfI family oxidoreductase [Gammaproteobacteria bacterium]
MSNTGVSTVSTRLNGLFMPGFTSDRKVVIDVKTQQPTPGTYPFGEAPSIDILDGRELQASEDDGEANFHSRFFKKHGFVLLQHESKVQNWDSGAFGATDAAGDHSVDLNSDAAVNEVELHYLPEVDDIIRNILLPAERIEIDQPNMLLRRGENTPNPFFGLVVHNDYGRTADDYAENAMAFGNKDHAYGWRNRFDRDEVRGHMMINFWRTVHMSRPLQHLPLAVLDASTVQHDDLVSSGLKGFTMSGQVTNQLSLRYNEDQRWYYYPSMTTNEVLVLNLFEYHKTDDGKTVYNTYHSAFEAPLPQGDVEHRQSCEHRVSVFLLKD